MTDTKRKPMPRYEALSPAASARLARCLAKLTATHR